MGFKICLWVGRFDSSLPSFPEPAEPIPRESFERVLQRFGDCDESGQLLRGSASKDGKTAIIGYVNGEYIIFRHRGLIEVNLGQNDPRMDQFLTALVANLECRIYAPDRGEWWTERFVLASQ